MLRVGGGGGLQNERKWGGGKLSFIPTKRGMGRKQVLAMLKVGHKNL